MIMMENSACVRWAICFSYKDGSIVQICDDVFHKTPIVMETKQCYLYIENKCHISGFKIISRTHYIIRLSTNEKSFFILCIFDARNLKFINRFISIGDRQSSIRILLQSSHCYRLCNLQL